MIVDLLICIVLITLVLPLTILALIFCVAFVIDVWTLLKERIE